MVRDSAAQSVMGNHEFNAIAFHTQVPHKSGVSLTQSELPHGNAPDDHTKKVHARDTKENALESNTAEEFLRPHTPKNIRQHQETLDQLCPTELDEYLAWFRMLPVALDLNELRIIHACWDDASIAFVNEQLTTSEPFNPEFMSEATTQGTDLFERIERILKGPEVQLPAGVQVHDKDGHTRRRVRIRWFEDPAERSLGSYSLPDKPELDHLPVPDSASPSVYDSVLPPIFVGHYWLSGSSPSPLADNVACLDYSVARGGMLCAYRFDGESSLSSEKYVTVESRPTRDASGMTS